jgi:S1-C subfamily serine protease
VPDRCTDVATDGVLAAIDAAQTVTDTGASMTITRTRTLATFISCSVLAAACAAGPSGEVEPIDIPAGSTSRPTTTIGETVTAVEPGAPVRSLRDVLAATVRIEAVGEFVHPIGADMPSAAVEAGVGSGFVLDGANHVVTSAHVVAGAERALVYAYGEEEPRQAEIIGIDECEGVAVLRFDGEPLPYLEWYDPDRVASGLRVYAAGYVNDESRYDLQAGKITQDLTRSPNTWSSALLSVGHTAAVPRGSAGGPVVDEQARVVGVTAPSDTIFGVNTVTTVFAGAAIPVVNRLLRGEELTFGINPQAVVSDTGYAGIWVTAVAPGSWAERTGVLPGDHIRYFGHPMQGDVEAPSTTSSPNRAADDRFPSMKRYCGSLKAAIDAGGPQGRPITVVRYATGDILSGTIGSPVSVDSAGSGKPGLPILWTSITSGMRPKDAFELIQVDAPASWSQTKPAPVSVFQDSAAFLLTTENVKDFESGKKTTGSIRVLSSQAYAPDKFDIDALIELVVSTGVVDGCQAGERTEYTRNDVVALADTIYRKKIGTWSPPSRGTLTKSEDVFTPEDTGIKTDWTVVTYRDCDENGSAYTIGVGHLPPTPQRPNGAGFIVEVQTPHEILHDAAAGMIAVARIDGWP